MLEKDDGRGVAMRLPRFPMTATCITPAEDEDSRGNKVLIYSVPPATTKTYNVWVWQNSSVEEAEDGRVPTVLTWSLMVDAENEVFTDKQRWIWNGETFEVFGMPEPCYTLRRYHHTELRMKQING